MLDVAGFINEAARDSEHLAVINNLQETILDWDHASEMRLTDYGRLIKDGELKIKAHDDQKTRNRYVFIFDKCILICKQLKVENNSNLIQTHLLKKKKTFQYQQFAFRDVINISDYHVEDMPNKTTPNSWSYNFHLVKKNKTIVYTIFIRTMELKNQMMKAISDAQLVFFIFLKWLNA